MPQIRSKQILGETPVNPNDLTTKAYVDSLIHGGGGGQLTIEDENVVVSSGATIINFIGADVRADVDINGYYRVNVYIPPPLYSPYFNSSNNVGSAIIPNYPTVNRYISLPTAEGNPFKIGNWTGGSVQPTIRKANNVLTYTTPDAFSISNLTTTIDVVVYDANGTTPLANNILLLDSNKSNTTNNISITLSGLQADSDRYKGIISVSINIVNILPNGGRFSVKITHNNGIGGIHIFTQNNIFRDNETISAYTSGLLTVNPNLIYLKTISGVKYYTINTNWEINVDQINNLNNMSYPTTAQISITDNNFYISEVLNVNGEGGGSFYQFFSGTWNRNHDNTGARFNKTNWITDQVNHTNWSHSTNNILTTNVRLTINDWSMIAQSYSQNYNYIIDTLVDDSDRNSERFRSENGVYNRLKDDFTTTWDNTESLLNNNGLQIIGDRLVYPQFNFENYLPNTATDNNDYSTLNTDRTYIRNFETNSALYTSNGKIVFTDHNITESDIDNDNIIIEISIDGGTNWLTFNGQFGLTPNSCRVYVDTYGLIGSVPDNDSMAFTFGNPPNNFATSMLLRITMTYGGRDKYIDGIDILNNEIDGGNEWT